MRSSSSDEQCHLAAINPLDKTRHPSLRPTHAEKLSSTTGFHTPWAIMRLSGHSADQQQGDEKGRC